MKFEVRHLEISGCFIGDLNSRRGQSWALGARQREIVNAMVPLAKSLVYQQLRSMSQGRPANHASPLSQAPGALPGSRKKRLIQMFNGASRPKIFCATSRINIGTMAMLTMEDLADAAITKVLAETVGATYMP